MIHDQLTQVLGNDASDNQTQDYKVDNQTHIWKVYRNSFNSIDSLE